MLEMEMERWWTTEREGKRENDSFRHQGLKIESALQWHTKSEVGNENGYDKSQKPPKQKTRPTQGGYLSRNHWPSQQSGLSHEVVVDSLASTPVPGNNTACGKSYRTDQ